MGNKTLLLSAICIIFILIIFGLLFFMSIRGGESPLGTFPTPTPYRGEGAGAAPGMEGPKTNEGKLAKDRSVLVYGLVPQTPVVGKNFSLHYSYADDLFIVYINPLAKQEGNAEFLSFLKQNGVLEKAWIENLFTTYVSPTPFPQVATASATPAP